MVKSLQGTTLSIQKPHNFLPRMPLKSLCRFLEKLIFLKGWSQAFGKRLGKILGCRGRYLLEKVPL